MISARRICHIEVVRPACPKDLRPEIARKSLDVPASGFILGNGFAWSSLIHPIDERQRASGIG